MPRKSYTTEQKEEILKKAKEIGAAAAAKAEGVSYPTVLKWMKDNGASVVEKVKNLPGECCCTRRENSDHPDRD